MTKSQIFVIMLVLLIGNFVRFHNLSWNPGWYTDEGTHVEIARHLLNGETQYLGITDSYLIAARLPLFEHLLALWFRLVGVGMFQLRLLTSFLGLLIGIAVYLLMVAISRNRILALGAMLLYAIYPQAVIYSRFGFSYNLLALLILIGLYFIVRHRHSNNVRHIILGFMALGFAVLSDFIALSFLPVFVIYSVYHHRFHTVIGVFVMLSPLGLYALYEMSQHADIFLFDLTYTLARAGGLPIDTQVSNVINNIEVLLTSTWWIPLGILGLCFVRDLRLRWLMLAIVIIPILISGRTVALHDLSAYYMIPFLPFFAIGLATLFDNLCNVLSVSLVTDRYIYVSLLLFVVVLTSINFTRDIQNGFQIGIEHFLISEDEAQQIKESLIDYTKDDTYIITSPTLAWMFDAQVTDFQIASLTATNSVHFPADLYPERFAFEIHYQTADYAVVDNLWRDWGAVHMPVVADMLATIQTWELIFETNMIQVYKNPKT